MFGFGLYPVLTPFVGPSRLRGVCSGSEAEILPLALTRAAAAGDDRFLNELLC